MTSVFPKPLDVWDIRTLDQDILDVLESKSALIRSYYETDNQIFRSYDLGHGKDRPLLRPSNEYWAMFSSFLNEIDQYMKVRTIRAFHYSRLTDHEVQEFHISGVRLSTPEYLRSRLDFMVAARYFDSKIADQLYAASPIHGDQLHSRSGKFWMVSHPLMADDCAVAPLLEYWGGEVVSMRIRDDALSNLLKTLGKARIVEISVPLKATQHVRNDSTAVVATYGRSLGVLTGQEDFDLYVVEPLPAASVLAIHTEGTDKFNSVGRTYPPGFCNRRLDRWNGLSGEGDQE